MNTPTQLERLRRHPHLPLVLGLGGLLATFGAMLAVSAERIGTIALVPWVAVLATQWGVAGGAATGAAAFGLYLVAAEEVGGQLGSVALVIRGIALVGLGAAAGFGARRIATSEQAYRRQSALQSTLIDSTFDGICLTDVDGNLLLANAPLLHAARELEIPQEGTVTERLVAISDRVVDSDRYRNRMLALARTPEAVSEDEFELKGSGRVFRGYTAPVRNPDGSLGGRVWTLREVTADRQLERLRDAFVASVSHELRTPITSISGFLELLGDEEDTLSEEGRGYLTIIRRSTVRLQRIVEDLLLVAQIEADRLELQPEHTDLAELAAAAVEEALPVAAEKGVDLTLDAEGACPLEGDEHRLGQVLANLVSNAVKFTEPGGTVTLRVGGSDSRAEVAVADTGVGIPAAEQEQLFSRFFRASTATRRAIPGTGLGLVIARAIVEGHGGTIDLKSREGVGTTVTVTLPRQAGGA